MEPQNCAKCKEYPEDILMLNCSHDLCLACAAQRFALEYRRNSFANFLTCERCKTKTELDRGSSGELIRLINASSSKEHSRHSGLSQSRSQDFGEPVLAATGNLGSVVPTGFRAIRRSCKEHLDEEVSYFCFTCLAECICSECIIHGEHKNHEVKTIKKSLPAIKDKLERFRGEAETAIEGYSQLKDGLERGGRQWSELIQKQKRTISNAFDQFRVRLNVKQKQILAKCDYALQLATEEYKQAERGINKQVEELRGVIKLISDIGRKDQISLLNFYAAKKAELDRPKVKEAVGEPGENCKRRVEGSRVAEALMLLAGKLGEVELDSDLDLGLKEEEQLRQ